MPQNGYWIECIPVKIATGTLGLTENESAVIDQGDRNNYQGDQYRAILSSIPDLNVVAQSPDQAIDKLRHKLRALGRYYRMTGRILPESDNPVRPPKNLRSVHGWISVYVQFTEKCGNC
ncbi:MAG: hypothetical protein PHX61_04550 [Alphaproteobacteria bacterium]|nr:hypothetical protein [Alphaproteobacteria bacterium]OIN86161.1 MAG: hypothetical protein AUJ12_06725 [Alphaproteobacteria bacterium CG1_02_46_17]